MSKYLACYTSRKESVMSLKESNMLKLLITCFTLMLFSSSAYCFTFLSPYQGPIKFKYTNWEEEDKQSPGNKNGIIDQGGEVLRGIAKIQTINAANTSNTLIWFDGKDGEELTVEFGGYTATSITPVTGGQEVNFTGGWYNMYLGKPVNFNATYPGTGVTDGVLFLSFKGVPGIVSTDPTVTLRSTVDQLTSPLSGKGAGYLEITGGSHADLFGGVGARLFLNSDLTAPDPAGSGWPVTSEDPLLGVTGCTGSIGDFVWHDLDQNGYQDINEPGIDGVTISLYNTAHTLIATSTTGIGPLGEHGYYQFTGLCADTYTVEVGTPTGFIPTTPSSNDMTIPDDSNATPAKVTLGTNNSSNQTIDFGFITPCSSTIGDFVWHDLNQNGIQDTGEPGIDGVQVKLLDASQNVIATTTTSVGPSGQHGYYQFSGLCIGSYYVEVVTPAGFAPTSPCGNNMTIPDDSNCSPASVVITTYGESNQTIDFGFITPCTGSIGDFIWNVKNRNALQDPDEPGINGVTVKLFDMANNLLATTTTSTGPTGKDGYYQFTGICASTYYVEAITPAGFSPTIPCSNDMNTPNDSNCSPSTIILTDNESSNQTIDFGYFTGTGCTYTQGFWKTHPHSWPVCSLNLGNISYSKYQLVRILKTPVKGNGLVSLAHQLIAAKLNYLSGTSLPAEVGQAIIDADTLINGLIIPPIGNGYLPPSTTTVLVEILDQYNNGIFPGGPNHCDSGKKYRDRDDGDRDD